MEKEIDLTNIEEDSPLKFVKEVARYFMNFLDTDFKRGRIPKRNTVQNTQKGLKVGFDLKKYPKLKKDLLAILNNGFEKEELKIKKGEYTTNIPDLFSFLIINKIGDISEENIEIIFDEIKKTIKENVINYTKEYDKFLEETIEQTKNIITKNLILPFLDELDKPLENLDMADENSKYQLEIDMVDSLFSLFEEKYREILQGAFQNPENFNPKDSLREIIKLPEIKNNLINFIKNIVIGDAFYDTYQLYRNTRIIDKTEIYIYFYEIALGKAKFPLFYIPITIKEDEKKFTFQFEKRLFINTKAINFVVQEYNLLVQKKSTLAGEFERILYISGDHNFLSILDNVIKKIENFFEFTKNIDLTNAEFQKSENLICSLSNKCYIYLFDKSDEALINDYEEILNDDGVIIDNFSRLINGFIEENPRPYMEEIDKEWQEENIPQRLVFESPIPLNTEQKQILMALKKPSCKYTILEGPPGTGKSHTITAIICEAILSEKSVLVLSDKKEALDVVEDKISITLNKIRKKDDYQSPILRLGKTGNKFYKIVQGQAIQMIREFYYSYEHEKNEQDAAINNALSKLKQNIKENIDHFEGISFQDIEFYFKNIDKFSRIHWIYENFTGNDLLSNMLNDEKSSFSEKDFLRIKRTVQKMQDIKGCPFKTSSITRENLKSFNELHAFFSNLEKAKTSFHELENFQRIIEELENISFEKRSNIFQNLEKISNLFNLLNGDFSKSEYSYFKNINTESSLSEIRKEESILKQTEEMSKLSNKYFEMHLDKLDFLENLIIPKEISIFEAIKELDNFIKELRELHKPVLGYLFKKEKISELSRKLKKTYHFFNIVKPQKYIKIFLDIYDLFEYIYSKLYGNENIEEIFRNTVRLLIGINIQEKKDIYNKNKDELHLISNEISKFQEFRDIKISEIKKYTTLITLVYFENNIQRLHSELNINNLMPDVSSQYLLYGNTEKDIKFLESSIGILGKLIESEEDLRFIEGFQENNSRSAKEIGLDVTLTNVSDIQCSLLTYPDEFILNYFNYKKIEQKLEKQFNNLPEDIYSDSIVEIEDLITAKMTYFLDKSIIEYTDHYANEVNNLKDIIKKKKKFPRPLFQNLKKAFPCILSGIRDYAEFIPLEKDLFDLVIIDEASQVSIAQALPAIIRGKQLIVLGDDKQFSNVKANNASTVTNNELRKKVQNTFYNERLNGEDKYGWMTKVEENFNIKKSILKFLRFIRNYECQLKKHFRCYPEIISYSDKYFYKNTLQCMKIRGKLIEDVIKIDIIEHDGKFDETKNTNELEAEFIISKLKEFKANNVEQSIGIISPHREQVTLLFDKINDLFIRDWLFEKCKLKIMTFDTCQGEERDYIFYSMVATREKDRLNWIFPKNLEDSIERESIKAQRMNVGFSRAKETIHFVLSKPIEEYQNEIEKALIHYKNELENGKKLHIGGTDKKSPIEEEIQKYFYQTLFYKNNKEKIEFIPQFPIGEYLKQINKDYNHPLYKIDFLLIYDNQKIVIEYDGFKEHFADSEDVNESNYKYYLKDDDIYRQKILEGYGYKFLRINKFNIGKDQVKTLNERLENIVKKKSKVQK